MTAMGLFHYISSLLIQFWSSVGMEFSDLVKDVPLVRLSWTHCYLVKLLPLPLSLPGMGRVGDIYENYPPTWFIVPIDLLITFR